jgi:antirestriction protein ArdC
MATIGTFTKTENGFDKRFIFSAAAHAQRAVDYLHGLQPNVTEERAA